MIVEAGCYLSKQYYTSAEYFGDILKILRILQSPYFTNFPDTTEEKYYPVTFTSPANADSHALLWYLAVNNMK